MDTKEMDCVLVNAQDKKGYVWSFTLRGKNVAEQREKIDEIGAVFENQEYKPAPSQRGYQSPMAPKPVQTTIGTPINASVAPDIETCPIHNVTMYGKEGKYGKFYSHKMVDGTWCNGKVKGKSY